MKIRKEDLEDLTAAVKRIDQPQARAKFKAAGKTDSDYRWACFWNAEGAETRSKRLYSYLSDAHIDTALRSIVTKL